MSGKKRIARLTEQILECYDAANDKWFNRKKFSLRHEDRLRLENRRIDEIREKLFIQLWEAYDGSDELEIIEEYPGFDNKARLKWCDGVFHFVTSKKEKLKYAYQCDC